MDKEGKKALDEKYGVPQDVEEFAAKIADKQDNPSIHELAKEFPEKTYKELESYRNTDRQEEANQIPLTQAQKNLVEHIESAVENSKKRKGVCVTAEMRKDRTPLDKMKRRAQEAEGELSIMKGIETNRVKEAQARCDHLQNELDRCKKENNDLFNRIADALAVDESHQKMNGKLQERLTELEEENKKMHDHLDKQVDNARKSGM